MKEKMYDLKRLGKVINSIEKINEVIYHMDDSEYERFKTYIYNRFDISFPISKPTDK